MHKTINKCRICGNNNLIAVINLGKQFMDGIFPSRTGEILESLPLEVVKCHNVNEEYCCGLVQLKHQHLFEKAYWETYGYRSGLNQSMLASLASVVNKIVSYGILNEGDIVLDIGSNDATLLKHFPRNRYQLFGMDPGGNKLQKYYTPNISLIPEAFSSDLFLKYSKKRKAKIVTSVAMLYDIEYPLDFMRQVYDILEDKGIWAFEQSYMPSMLENNAYDAICHEHLSYFGLTQIVWMAKQTGFKIIDVEFNAVNGGSFLVIASKSGSQFKENTSLLERILSDEKDKYLSSLLPFEEFKKRVYSHREDLLRTLRLIKESGKKVIGYGASTKGNVLLQFCGITNKDIPFIAEINEDKIGRYTPFTNIPIISEHDAFSMNPDYLLVLPWHFKDYFLLRERLFLEKGGKLILPLPTVEIVGRENELLT